MSWDFVYVRRATYLGDDNWGDLFLQDGNGHWERLCYTYELPWIVSLSGQHAGKSKNNHSRIKIGTYDLKVRTSGTKGWRLQLEGTGHRKWIQIHRAHKSMYIEGCILPVEFNNLEGSKIKKGSPEIQNQSVALMKKIKDRYDELKVGKEGKPTLMIAAILPPVHHHGHQKFGYA
jgi:hypothetical protein